jgi:5-oxoprolinase (ATP-hydrolysing)
VAEGFLRIAVENMANAIKKISVQRGYDVTEYTLNCFGGAGGQHACLVADALGMTKVFLHPFAGVLSAYGMGLADVRALRERQVEAPLLRPDRPAMEAAYAELLARTPRGSARQGVARRASGRASRRSCATRAPTPRCPSTSAAWTRCCAAFEAAHRQRFGFVAVERKLVVEAVGRGDRRHRAEVADPEREVAATPNRGPPLIRVEMYYRRRDRDTPLYDRDALLPGQKIDGPAIISRGHRHHGGVEPGWQAELTGGGHLVLTRERRAAPRRSAPRPIR